MAGSSKWPPVEPLDQFLQSRIFAPLHMVDTGFYVPEEKLDRLVDAPMPERPRIWDVTTPAKLFSGDGGLVSTAPDYLRFCQMLLNGGELDGVRVLSPQAVKAMTTNALPSGTRIYGGDEVGARCRNNLWTWLRHPHRSGLQLDAGSGRKLFLGRALGHVFLD